MNAQDLIEELKKLSPVLPVRVKVRGVTRYYEDGEGGGREWSDGGEGELDDVRFEGNHISLEGE